MDTFNGDELTGQIISFSVAIVTALLVTLLILVG